MEQKCKFISNEGLQREWTPLTLITQQKVVPRSLHSIKKKGITGATKTPAPNINLLSNKWFSSSTKKIKRSSKDIYKKIPKAKRFEKLQNFYSTKKITQKYLKSLKKDEMKLTNYLFKDPKSSEGGSFKINLIGLGSSQNKGSSVEKSPEQPILRKKTHRLKTIVRKTMNKKSIIDRINSVLSMQVQKRFDGNESRTELTEEDRSMKAVSIYNPFWLVWDIAYMAVILYDYTNTVFG